MYKRNSQEEEEFRKDLQALIEAVNDTEGMDPKAAEVNKNILMDLIREAFDITDSEKFHE
jgi:phage-related tail protein